jgi:hypothetical protein
VIFIHHLNILSGDFKYNQINGNGILKLKNGELYEGDFVEGKFHGELLRGTYVGMLSARLPFSISSGITRSILYEGVGVYRYANGNVYYGEFLNNLPHGYGIYKYMNGDTYEGMPLVVCIYFISKVVYFVHP